MNYKHAAPLILVAIFAPCFAGHSQTTNVGGAAIQLSVPGTGGAGNNGSVNSGTAGLLGYYQQTGTSISALPGCSSGVFSTTTASVAQCSATLPPLIGFQSFTGSVSATTTTSYTFLTSNCGQIGTLSASTVITATLPNSASVGCTIAAMQLGTASASFTASVGATLKSAHCTGISTALQYSVVTLAVYANVGGTSASWVIAGDCT